jgi:hypothetical protein
VRHRYRRPRFRARTSHVAHHRQRQQTRGHFPSPRSPCSLAGQRSRHSGLPLCRRRASLATPSPTRSAAAPTPRRPWCSGSPQLSSPGRPSAWAALGPDRETGGSVPVPGPPVLAAVPVGGPIYALTRAAARDESGEPDRPNTAKLIRADRRSFRSSRADPIGAIPWDAVGRNATTLDTSAVSGVV